MEPEYCYECSFFDAFLYKAYSPDCHFGYCENKDGDTYGRQGSASDSACKVASPNPDIKKVDYIKNAIED